MISPWHRADARLLFALIMSSVLLGGCSAPADDVTALVVDPDAAAVVDATPPDEGDRASLEGGAEAVPIRVVYTSQRCGFEQQTVRLVRDAQALTALGAELAGGSGMLGASPVPLEIDLEHAVALIVGLGPYPTGGHVIELAAATVTAAANDTLVVPVTVVHPPADAMASQAFTSPCLVLELATRALREVSVVDQTDQHLGTVAW